MRNVIKLTKPRRETKNRLCCFYHTEIHTSSSKKPISLPPAEKQRQCSMSPGSSYLMSNCFVVWLICKILCKNISKVKRAGNIFRDALKKANNE